MDGTRQEIILDILLFMGEHGVRYKESELEDLFDYVDRMAADKRIAVVYYCNQVHAVIFFSICDDYLNYLRKPMWIYKEHNPNGKIAYIEKMVCVNYNKEIRKRIEHLITSLYPQVQFGKWHRYGKLTDREVSTKEIMHVTV